MVLPLLLAVGGCSDAHRRLDLPPRPSDAVPGSQLARELRGLDLELREERILAEVLRGNVPTWLRRLHPVTVSADFAGDRRTITFWAAPDYLAVGSDQDFLRIPLSPGTAWRVADAAGASLPTPAMSDAIWEAATVRLGPTPIPPNRLMTTVPVFEDHQRKVQRQRDMAAALPGALVAGHKKDVVITPRLRAQPGHVAIYGWHYLNGDPIQPLYLGHTDDWVDYSHGIRLVDDSVEVDGTPKALADVLADPEVANVLSREGPIGPDAWPAAPAGEGRR